MEIERKFLIKDNKKVEELIEKYKNSKKTIKQDYIYSDIFTSIRIIKYFKSFIMLIFKFSYIFTSI